jgi:hypothetical protein
VTDERGQMVGGRPPAGADHADAGRRFHDSKLIKILNMVKIVIQTVIVNQARHPA